MNKVRTRFAPSPTGYMHIGNLRSALFEYVIAKSNKGDFILRIEDTDQTRKVDGALDFIYKTLDLCGITFDEGPSNPGEYGPYVQSERLELYREYAKKLVDMKKAYYCFCSEERLEILRKEAEEAGVPFLYDGKCSHLSQEEIEIKMKDNELYVIRQKMPHEGNVNFTDLVYGNIMIENRVLEDQILIKSDLFPTYNFANVIDDHLMEISHVIRGNEYLSQTPKYIHLYQAFDWEVPDFIHLPHVTKEGGKKLSKREGDASFMDLYHDGYLPEAIVNYLALLGFAPKDNVEIFTLNELIEKFDISRINKSPAVYDIKKLNWVNSHYIKSLSLEDLIKITLPHLKEAYNLDDKSDDFIRELISIHQEQLSYGKEIVELTKMFLEDDLYMDKEALEFMMEDGVNDTLRIFREEIENIVDWTIPNITDAINKTKEKANVKGKMLYMPIRVKTTGLMHGPELPNTLYLLGKNKILDRLNK